MTGFRSKRKFFLILVQLIFTALFSQIAQANADTLKVTSDNPSRHVSKNIDDEQQETIILPGDVLTIVIPDQKEMTHTYDVDPSGNLYMVMVGKITARGVDTKELEDKLTQELRQYLEKGKKVSVRFLKSTRYIQVTGGIHYPGWYRVPRTCDIYELIEMAGGLLPGASLAGTRLRRRMRKGWKDFSISGRITLHPDDMIIVPSPEGYGKRIDKGDLLFVSIPQRQAPTSVQSTMDVADLSAALSQSQIEVDENGYLYIPEYGRFYANNKTPDEIRTMIKEKLPKYMSRFAKIDVGIIKKQHHVGIFGHVARPGVYNPPETANIQEAIAAAGGVLDGAVMNDIMIQRKKSDGKIQNIKVNVYQYIITGDPRLLTPVHENDVIFVPISSSFGNIKRTLMPWTPPPSKLEKETKQKVQIFGAVHNPGIYEPTEDMDLVKLLVLAGGARDDAELSDILIIGGGKVYMRYDLSKFFNEFKEGSAGIPEIQGGDTVYVSFVQKREYEARERIFVIGNVRRPDSYELYDNMTVLQALGWAGGLSEWADSDHIMVVRMVGGKQQNTPYNYTKGVRGRFPEVNIRLRANDVVVVP